MASFILLLIVVVHGYWLFWEVVTGAASIWRLAEEERQEWLRKNPEAAWWAKK